MNILVCDLGIGFEHARRLALEGNTVYYYVHWEKAFPSYRDYMVGTGYDEVIKVLSPFDVLDRVDLIVFTDSGQGGFVEFLRKNLQIPVFGAGIGEKLELNRNWSKKVFDILGIKYPPYKQIIGKDNLIKYLKENSGKKVIKTNIFRGDLETFIANDVLEAENKLNSLAERIGFFINEYEFSVEDFIEGVETGFDLFFNGRSFITPYLYGFEINGNYIGKFVDMMPYVLQDNADRLTKYFRQVNYRGAFSNEGLVNNEIFYFLDATCRFPYPLSMLYTKVINNYTELIYKVARGEEVNIEINKQFPYVCVLNIWCDDALKYPVHIYADNFENIRVRCPIKYHNNVYTVVGETTICSIIHIGKTYQEAINKCLEEVDEISFSSEITYDTGFLNTAERTITEAKNRKVMF